jgi:hypothetical protein
MRMETEFAGGDHRTLPLAISDEASTVGLPRGAAQFVRVTLHAGGVLKNDAALSAKAWNDRCGGQRTPGVSGIRSVIL